MTFVSFAWLEKQKHKNSCAKTSVYFQLKTLHKMRTTFRRQCTKNKNEKLLPFNFLMTQRPNSVEFRLSSYYNVEFVGRCFSLHARVCMRYTQANIRANIYSHLWFECAYTHSICFYPTLFCLVFLFFASLVHLLRHTHAPLSIFYDTRHKSRNLYEFFCWIIKQQNKVRFIHSYCFWSDSSEPSAMQLKKNPTKTEIECRENSVMKIRLNSS